MSWTDAVRGLIGQAEQAAVPELINRFMGAQGLQTILAKLKDAGFAAQVPSWLDKNKDNLPITPEQLRAALGDQHVQQIAKSLGIPSTRCSRRWRSTCPRPSTPQARRRRRPIGQPLISA